MKQVGQCGRTDGRTGGRKDKRTDGETDMMKLIVSFPKIYESA